MAQYIFPNIPNNLSQGDILIFDKLDSDLTYTIPGSMNVEIEISGGAGGGNSYYGKGAVIKGGCVLEAGSSLTIRVGSKGTKHSKYPFGSGGNGSYVEVNKKLLLCAGAGGGVGAGNNTPTECAGGDASLTTKGTKGKYTDSDYPPKEPGNNGNDGSKGNGAWGTAGGKGYNNGGKCVGSKFVDTEFSGGGAGGGYSGGAGASMDSGKGVAGGGGGGSYKSSLVDIISQSISNNSNGIVKIKVIDLQSSTNAYCKIDGTIRKVDKISVKVNESWKDVDSIYVKIDGNWKKTE